MNIKSVLFTSKYSKSTSWLIGEKVFRLIIVFLINILLARCLGSSAFGELNYALSLVGILTVFTTLGLNDIIVKEIVEKDSAENSILGSSLIMKFLGSLLLLLVLLIILEVTNENFDNRMIIMIIAFATVFHSFKVIEYFFISKTQSKYIAISYIIALSLVALLNLIFVYFELSLIYFAIVYIVESVLIMLGLVYFYQKKINSVFNWKFSPKKCKELLYQSWPLILSGLFISIYMKIDQVMIKSMIDNQSVGHYAAAVRISEAWYFIPVIICSSFFPAILEYKKSSREVYLKRLQTLYDFMFVVSLSVAIIMNLFGSDIIHVFYGVEYSDSAGVLIIHIWSGIFISLGVARGKWILAENLQNYTMYYLVGGCLINICLNIIMIPIYGIKGAAMASLLSQFSSVFLIPFFIPKTRMSTYMMLKSMIMFHVIKQFWKLLGFKN